VIFVNINPANTADTIHIYFPCAHLRTFLIVVRLPQRYILFSVKNNDITAMRRDETLKILIYQYNRHSESHHSLTHGTDSGAWPSMLKSLTASQSAILIRRARHALALPLAVLKTEVPEYVTRTPEELFRHSGIDCANTRSRVDNERSSRSISSYILRTNDWQETFS